MIVKFEVEKVLKFDPIEVELDDEQVAKIQEYADKHSMSFDEAFRHAAEFTGVLFDIMWDKDHYDYDYTIWDVKVEGNK